jgi:hypothetical protein
MGQRSRQDKSNDKKELSSHVNHSKAAVLSLCGGGASAN